MPASLKQQTTSAPCPLCAAETEPWLERNGFPIVKCRSCGFGFAVIPENFDFHSVYQDESYWTGGTSYGYQNDYDAVIQSGMNQDFARRLDRIATYGSPPGRLLEIGCAAGYFLKLALGAGWKAEGLEISAVMRKKCAERVGTRVYASFDEVMETGRRFDCVVMFEVLEHVADPTAMLRRVGELMNPGSLLAISTPNFRSYGAQTNSASNLWFEPPAHISYFGSRNLVSCLEQADFEVLEMENRIDQVMPLPRVLSLILHPLKRNRVHRPHGPLKKLFLAWQARHSRDLYWADFLVAYARKR